MVQKPRIAIVGPGNLGTALAIAVHDAGFVIDVIQGRTGSRQAQALAGRIGARADVIRNSNAGVVWFCVPDSEIPRVAELCANHNWKKKVALHSSGALTSDVLSPLRNLGAAVASAHPLMTFVRHSQPSFRGVPFAIEGDVQGVRTARQIVRALGAVTYPIGKDDKAAYHAWGTFASPLFTALLATTEQVAAVAGVKGIDARKRMMPILKQTLANYEQFGGAGAFSGPLIRGDVDTVRTHLRVLHNEPAIRAVYVALARAALKYLPARNKRELQRVLTVK